jgi:transposase-like protein
LKVGGASHRFDETYVKVGKTCKRLYPASDEEENTTEFMLSAKRDVSAAKRFFKKKVRASQRFKRLPRFLSCFVPLPFDIVPDGGVTARKGRVIRR